MHRRCMAWSMAMKYTFPTLFVPCLSRDTRQVSKLNFFFFSHSCSKRAEPVLVHFQVMSKLDSRLQF